MQRHKPGQLPPLKNRRIESLPTLEIEKVLPPIPLSEDVISDASNTSISLPSFSPSVPSTADSTARDYFNIDKSQPATRKTKKILSDSSKLLISGWKVTKRIGRDFTTLAHHKDVQRLDKPNGTFKKNNSTKKLKNEQDGGLCLPPCRPTKTFLTSEAPPTQPTNQEPMKPNQMTFLPDIPATFKPTPRQRRKPSPRVVRPSWTPAKPAYIPRTPKVKDNYRNSANYAALQELRSKRVRKPHH